MSINIDEQAVLFGIIKNQELKIVKKEWGEERILPGDGYTTKVMIVNPGFKCSLHFHRHKNETFVLVQGRLNIEFYEPDSTRHTYLMKVPLSALILPAGTPHTFSVPKDQEESSIFIESSTLDDKEDNYRLTKSGIDV